MDPNETAMVWDSATRFWASRRRVLSNFFLSLLQVYSDVSSGRAFDGNFSSRWVSQCGPCRWARASDSSDT